MKIEAIFDSCNTFIESHLRLLVNPSVKRCKTWNEIANVQRINFKVYSISQENISNNSRAS